MAKVWVLVCLARLFTEAVSLVYVSRTPGDKGFLRGLLQIGREGAWGPTVWEGWGLFGKKKRLVVWR